MNPYLSYKSMYHVPTLFSLSWYVCKSIVDDAELKQRERKKIILPHLFTEKRKKKGCVSKNSTYSLGCAGNSQPDHTRMSSTLLYGASAEESNTNSTLKLWSMELGKQKSRRRPSQSHPSNSDAPCQLVWRLSNGKKYQLPRMHHCIPKKHHPLPLNGKQTSWFVRLG